MRTTADALAATHDRGFAVEIWSTPVARVRELVMLLGTDASTGALLDRLADELATHEEFLAVAVDPDGEYAVNVVNAPVFDHTGQVTLVLSLTGFGRPLRGAEVLTAGARLVDATTKLTDRTARTPDGHCRGATSGVAREAVRVSRPERRSVPLRASVSLASRTMAVPFTRTWSMPSASA